MGESVGDGCFCRAKHGYPTDPEYLGDLFPTQTPCPNRQEAFIGLGGGPLTIGLRKTLSLYFPAAAGGSSEVFALYACAAGTGRNALVCRRPTCREHPRQSDFRRAGEPRDRFANRRSRVQRAGTVAWRPKHFVCDRTLAFLVGTLLRRTGGLRGRWLAVDSHGRPSFASAFRGIMAAPQIPSRHGAARPAAGGPLV